MHSRLGIATQAHPVSKSYVGNCEGVSLQQISDYRSQISEKNGADFDAEGSEQAHVERERSDQFQHPKRMSYFPDRARRVC